jgi:hypothetical protein
MNRRKVEVGRDHVQRLMGTSPQKAIEELIWNALDAGGDRVEVTLRFNELGAVSRLEVADRGPGIKPDDIDRSFGSIGNSTKVERKINPDQRAYHGREGKGRFKALSLSPTVVWETRYRDEDNTLAYTIEVSRDSADYYEASEPKLVDGRATGTVVRLEGIDKGHQTLAREDMREKLAETFASYLTSYPGVGLFWDGRQLQVSELVERYETVDILSDRDPLGPAELQILEWKFKPDGKRLHICDEQGFSFHDIPAGVKAPGIEFTAYVRTSLAPEWADSARFVMEELDGDVNRLVDAAKDRLREYIRGRLAEESKSVVQSWKDEDIYPYAEEPADPLAAAEREVFDIVAVQINEQHPSFEKTDTQNKKLTLALVKQALESNPTSLTRILHEVISLGKEDRDAFAELLERTPLTNLIRAGKVVADRLDVIQAFEQILFDKDWKKRLLERTQLHRLLVHELWLLGEEYALGVDDDGLRTLLEKHLNLIGRAELAAEADIKQITGEDGVPDLMVYRRRKIDRDRFEHLVIELKRPSLKLGQAEVSQIERYAFTVADDERFDTKKCQWNFVLLGNSLDTFAKRRATSDNLPDGCIHQDNGVRVWIHPWAEVLNSARARYEFFRDQLKVEASHSKGIETLKARYPHLFDGKGARKERDLTISQAKSSK